MTQMELDKFRTDMELAKAEGDNDKFKRVKIAFDRRLHECQIHTGQRVERMEKDLLTIKGDVSRLLECQEKCIHRQELVKAKFEGARIAWCVLRYAATAIGGAGGGALILKMLGAH